MESQDADSPRPGSNSLMDTESQQQKRRGVRTAHDEGEGDDVYAACQLDYASSQIRIFTLYPSKGSDAHLAGSLRIAELGHETTTYEALSYVWGEEDRKYPLRLEQGEMRISTNLYVALQHLRQPSEPLDLWIDAICVDQSMNGEKNHQVQRMFEIYNQATKVLIWLGEADEDSELVLSEIEQGSLGRLEGIPNERKLNTILGKPWWKRIWTLQEGFAAKPDSLVVCGGRAVEWSKVCDQLPRFAECGVDPRYQNVIDFLAMCQSKAAKNASPSLQQLFWSSIARSAKDPRDYVYALLNPSNAPRTFALLPDYAKSANWAYQNAMLHIMRDAGDLALLVINALRNMPTKPSWCLDFSERTKLNAPRDIVERLAWAGRGYAAPTLSPSGLFQHDSENGTIKLIGRRIDEVIYPSRQCLGDVEAQEHSHEDFSRKLLGTPIKKIIAKDSCVRLYDREWECEGLGVETDLEKLNSCGVFVTAGKWLCESNAVVEEADIVCKIRGAILPLILRAKTEDTYTMVGVVGRWST